MVYNKIMETGRTPKVNENLIYRKEVFIMKKSTKVLFNAYKVIFALTAIALIVTYVR